MYKLCILFSDHMPWNSDLSTPSWLCRIAWTVLHYRWCLRGCLLGGVYIRCIHRMPGGVIVGDSGLCCCGPAFNVTCDVHCSSAMPSRCLLFCTMVREKWPSKDKLGRMKYLKPDKLYGDLASPRRTIDTLNRGDLAALRRTAWNIWRKSSSKETLRSYGNSMEYLKDKLW